MAADNSSRGERVILLAHGSRDAGWARPFEAVLREFRERFPRREVDLAFLQFMSPDLPSALGAAWRQGALQVRVVPLFLGSGRHLHGDLADIVRSAESAFDGLRISTAEPAGVNLRVIRALADFAGSYCTLEC